MLNVFSTTLIRVTNMSDAIRPNATVEWDYGNDGRDGHYYIGYTCPHCTKRLWEEDHLDVCPICETRLDWSKKAHIKVTRTVEWR